MKVRVSNTVKINLCFGHLSSKPFNTNQFCLPFFQNLAFHTNCNIFSCKNIIHLQHESSRFLRKTCNLVPNLRMGRKTLLSEGQKTWLKFQAAAYTWSNIRRRPRPGEYSVVLRNEANKICNVRE